MGSGGEREPRGLGSRQMPAGTTQTSLFSSGLPIASSEPPAAACRWRSLSVSQIVSSRYTATVDFGLISVSERSSNLDKVTQPVGGGPGIKRQLCRLKMGTISPRAGGWPTRAFWVLWARRQPASPGSAVTVFQLVSGLSPKEIARIKHFELTLAECQPVFGAAGALHLASNPLLKANKCVERAACTFSSGK